MTTPRSNGMGTPWSQGACLGAMLLLLGACGQSADTDDTVDAGDDGCSTIPMARALPPVDVISGKQLAWRQCSEVEVVAFYGPEDTGCEIHIADLQFENPPGSATVGAGAMFEQARAASMAMARISVEAVVEGRKSMESDPQIMAVFGGPPQLPVVDRTATGDTYVVLVPPVQTGPSQQPLLSVLRDRYSLRIECPDLVGTHDEARALYAPWLAATRLELLP